MAMRNPALKTRVEDTWRTTPEVISDLNTHAHIHLYTHT